MAKHMLISARYNGRPFRFALDRKNARFGSCQIPQFWMDIRELYGQRGTSAATLKQLADAFWAICQEEGAEKIVDNQQVYLLCRLLPEVRALGSNNVILDARLHWKSVRDKKSMMQLEAALRDTRHEGLTPEAFHEKTVAMARPSESWALEQERYRELEKRLLGQGQRRLLENPGAALRSAQARWRDVAGTARKKKNGELLRYLDIFSYECRAALHRCYSATWKRLILALDNEFDLSESCRWFHRFWQCELVIKDVSVFHGHVLGLHPGTGLLLQTAAGRDLMGSWLEDLNSNQKMFHLLHALYVCLLHYDALYESKQTVQRKRPFTTQDVDGAASWVLDRKIGSRKKGSRSYDAP